MESLLRQDLPLRKEFSEKKKKKPYVQSTPKVALRVNPVLQMDLTYRFQINKLYWGSLCARRGAGHWGSKNEKDTVSFSLKTFLLACRFFTRSSQTYQSIPRDLEHSSPSFQPMSLRPEYTQGKEKWVVIDFHSIWKLTASDEAKRC